MDAIFPVLLEVPAATRQLRGRELVQALSRHGRRALYRSAELRGADLGTLLKSESGAPLPSNGWHWSLSHKREVAAGVVASGPIGIDVEIRRPCSDALCRRIAAPEEWDLAGDVSEAMFFRFWTAKEAVLKAVGIGMKALSQCRITAVADHRTTCLGYRGQDWRVAHLYAHDWVVAVTDAGAGIHWTLEAGG